jgi:hypothetical protein
MYYRGNFLKGLRKTKKILVRTSEIRTEHISNMESEALLLCSVFIMCLDTGATNFLLVLTFSVTMHSGSRDTASATMDCGNWLNGLRAHGRDNDHSLTRTTARWWRGEAGIAQLWTGRLRGWGSVPSRGWCQAGWEAFLNSKASRPTLQPIQRPIKWVSGRSGRTDDHSLPKCAWSCTSFFHTSRWRDAQLTTATISPFTDAEQKILHYSYWECNFCCFTNAYCKQVI